MAHEKEDEERLLSQDSSDEAQTVSARNLEIQRKVWSRRLWISLIANVVLFVIAVLAYVQSVRPPSDSRSKHEIYTPAHAAVEYQQVVFIAGTKIERSPYQGSSDEVNTLWEDLYNEFGISRVTADEASQLPNATMPIRGTPDYMVQLDVFHQLHCLNLMRKLVYPSVFPMDLTSGSDKALEDVDHLEHCYEQLRQSIQCHSDLATIYWEWIPETKKAYGNLKTTHTCKNFDKVREWALDRKYDGDVDFKTEVEGAPIRHLDEFVQDHTDHEHGHHH